ncbi:MAG: PASTA domain-containing protein, partial [Cumulibacter sp.]
MFTGSRTARSVTVCVLSATLIAGCSASNEPSIVTSPTSTAVSPSASAVEDTVTIPDLVGLEAATAYSTATDAGLTVTFETGSRSSPVAVLEQTPRAGASVTAGSTVSLTLEDLPPEGTRSDPLPWDSAVSNDIAEVSLGKAMWDANELVAAENRFNDEAPSGMTYVLLPVTVTALSDESPLTPWLD